MSMELQQSGSSQIDNSERGKLMQKLLAWMAEHRASDLHLSVGARPHMKSGGVTRPINAPVLKSGEVQAMAYSFMTKLQIEAFERDLEANLALSIDGVGRFRVNVYYERGEVAMVLRLIQDQVYTFDDLDLPPACGELMKLRSGLVLVVGSVGSGKSTSLAAMVNHRAATKDGKILTIEDPIEYIFEHQKSLVSQREVGVDTKTFEEALRNALRAAPDVIMIGEIRDPETAKHALTYADTGHLCLATLHATNASQAVERLINFFPEEAHGHLLMELSLNLAGVIAQRLLPGVDGKGAKLVTEVLMRTSYVADLIQQGKINVLRDAIKSGASYGMHTFDQSIYERYTRGEIDLDTALANADSKTDLTLRIRLSEGDGKNKPASEGLSVNMDD